MTTQTPSINLYELLSVPTQEDQDSNPQEKEGKIPSLPTFNIKSEVGPLTLLGCTALGVIGIDVLIELGIAAASVGGLGFLTAAFSAFGVLSIGAMLFFVTVDFFNLRKA